MRGVTLATWCIVILAIPVVAQTRRPEPLPAATPRAPYQRPIMAIRPYQHTWYDAMLRQFNPDNLDRRFLSTIIQLYHGGPVGVEALAATLNEEVDTLVDMVEPFLLQQGFISRTKTGRKANEPAYRHLGLALPKGAVEGSPSLFE